MLASLPFPNFDLTGRVALVTGSGRGIGLGIARALAAAGCAVALQDIEQNVARIEAGNIVEAGRHAIALGGDIGDLNLPATLIEETVAQLGGLHILVNNAAIQRELSWREMPVDEIERELRANLVAPLLLCRAAAAIFESQNHGRILNIGSIQGAKGNAQMMPYAMSKAALENMTKALAKDLAKHGTTVNLLAPGYFNTFRNRDQFGTPAEEEKRGAHIPLGRVGYPHDCAGLALLLCSEAGSYITGQTIFVTGGLGL